VALFLLVSGCSSLVSMYQNFGNLPYSTVYLYFLQTAYLYVCVLSSSALQAQCDTNRPHVHKASILAKDDISGNTRSFGEYQQNKNIYQVENFQHEHMTRTHIL
jgi:hypothetical protein